MNLVQILKSCYAFIFISFLISSLYCINKMNAEWEVYVCRSTYGLVS